MRCNLAGFPTRWRPVQLKRVVDPVRPITYGIVQAGEDVSDGVPYIRPVDMSDEKGVTLHKLRRTSREIADTYRRSEVAAGDLVVSIGPSYGKVMVVPAGLTGANLTQGTARVCANGAIAHLRYLFWCMRSAPITRQWDYSVGGATFRALNLAPLAATSVPTPPLDAQRAIADFLDHKTAAIDDLIAKKERLIDLLREKRQALITQAVTKGLDPSVPMKDSGVEWIGEVPAHWSTPLLRRLARVQGGLAKGKVLSGPTRLFPYLRVANVQDGYVDTTTINEIEVEADGWSRYALRSGDVLMNEGGDNDKLGRGCVWRAQVDPCLHQNHVFAVRPGSHLSSEWLSAWTSGGSARSYFEMYAKQSTNLASISSSNLLALRVALPPIAEQHAILASVSSMTGALSRSELDVARSVDLLGEYRQALITNAVTGQLDIPGAA